MEYFNEEEKLYEYLMKTAHPAIRPQRNQSDQTTVHFGMALVEIMEVVSFFLLLLSKGTKDG